MIEISVLHLLMWVKNKMNKNYNYLPIWLKLIFHLLVCMATYTYVTSILSNNNNIPVISKSQ
jgi:hypothetical protein